MISASACQTGGGHLQNGYLRIYVDKSAQKDILYEKYVNSCQRFYHEAHEGHEK